MTRLEAFQLFLDRGTDHDIYPEEYPDEFVDSWTAADGEQGKTDWWPAMMTAAVVLSGRLRKCKTGADMDAAIELYLAPWEIDEVLDDASWQLWKTLAGEIQDEVRSAVFDLWASRRDKAIGECN